MKKTKEKHLSLEAQSLPAESQDNLRRALDKCRSLPDYFRGIHNQVNEALKSNEQIRATLDNFELDTEDILKAVLNNDFGNLSYQTDSEEYGLILQLTAIKNRMIAEAIRLTRDIATEKLHLSEAEWHMVEGYTHMMPATDNMYMSWRTNLFPPDLLKQLKKFDDSDEAAALLKKRGLDDPYAVAQKRNGKFVNVPYALAFPDDVRSMTARIDEMIGNLSNKATADTANMIAYLEAYKTALNCNKSKKIGGEWLSVKLWKEADQKWIACKERIQFVHGIENGYENTVDPSELKIIPELKLLIHKDVASEKSANLETMHNENADVLKGLLGNRKGGFYEKSYKVSHVGFYTVIMGGGNSMDNLGVAQIAPNYEDVWQEHGSKSYVDPDSVREDIPKHDAIAKSVFGDETFTRNFKFPEGDTEVLNRYVTEYIASHELGHMILGDMNTEIMEEAKATWSGLVPLWERFKQGKVSREVIELVMKEHIKYCLRYLAEEKDDDYKKEAFMNIKIFEEIGIIKLQEGQWSFDATKIDETYEAIKTVWLQLIDSYIAARDAGEDSKEESQHKSLLERSSTPDNFAEALMEATRKGMEKFNEEK